MQTHPNNHYNPLVGNILIQWIISNIPGMELKIEATISTLSYLTARCVGVSGILCKRCGHQISERRSPNSMVNRVSAAFQS